MAVPLTDQDIKDLVTGTLKRLGRLRFNQIATRLPSYEVMGRILKKDKVAFSDGTGIQRTIMVDHSGAAKQVGLYEPDQVNVADVLRTIDIPWRHTTVNYAYERHEMLMNKGESRIVDLLKVRRTDAMISLTEHMEAQFWSVPDAGNKLDVFGVPYWIVPNATEGFNGGNHANFPTGPGNLDASVYGRWKNWTAQYDNITYDDLLRKLKRAYRNINWKSPVDIPDFRNGNGQRYRIYCNEASIDEIETLAEMRNDNLGRDLFPYDGRVTFKGHPIIRVPLLDANNKNPLYMLDYSWFQPVVLSGDYLRESEPKQSPQQHNVWQVFIDLTWNLLCTDRRSQAVFQKP